MNEFYSGDPGDEHVERKPRTTECVCVHCSASVDEDEYTHPWCSPCYANVDGKCRIG